ncbi:MAG: hypothetical protein U1F65_08230 [Verrucomicrobiota bacterium]
MSPPNHTSNDKGKLLMVTLPKASEVPPAVKNEDPSCGGRKWLHLI